MIRAELDELKNIINTVTDDKIYYISQESNGYDFYVTKFNARSNCIMMDLQGGARRVLWRRYFGISVSRQRN